MKMCLITLIILASFNAFTADKIGIGPMVGNPTGLNAKYWQNYERAIDMAVAFNLDDSAGLSLHSDYLWHWFDTLYFKDTYPLDLYSGLGGRMKFSDAIQIGARIPVGVLYRQKDSSDFFIEAAPVLDFIGRSGIDLHLVFGARYYFW